MATTVPSAFVTPSCFETARLSYRRLNPELTAPASVARPAVTEGELNAASAREVGTFMAAMRERYSSGGRACAPGAANGAEFDRDWDRWFTSHPLAWGSEGDSLSRYVGSASWGTSSGDLMALGSCLREYIRRSDEGATFRGLVENGCSPLRSASDSPNCSRIRDRRSLIARGNEVALRLDRVPEATLTAARDSAAINRGDMTAQANAMPDQASTPEDRMPPQSVSGVADPAETIQEGNETSVSGDGI